MGLDRPSGRFVQLEVLLAAAGPHHVTFRLVPDLPVLDVVVKALSPTLVVMADDVHADLHPPGEVVGRVVVIVGPGLDALAQPVDDLRLVPHDRRQIVVGLGKRIVAGVVRVGAEDRKVVETSTASGHGQCTLCKRVKGNPAAAW